MIIEIAGPGDGSSVQAQLSEAQAQIDAAGGGMVYFTKPGIYGYERAIRPSAPTTWQGINGGVILKRLDGNALLDVPASVRRLCVRDLSFDFNGNAARFGTVLRGSGVGNVRIANNTFFDSNPPCHTEFVGTGDGVTSTFTHVWVRGDHQVLSGWVEVHAGTLQATDDRRGGWLGDATGGSVFYGDNNGSGGFTITFAAPPAPGEEITVRVGHCDQRQPILLGDCEDVWVTGNSLRDGGRIKVGSPGRRCIISSNILESVNDNGITVVDSTKVGPSLSCDLKILDNIIYFPGTTGIFVGADGEDEDSPLMSTLNIAVRGNSIVGNSMEGVKVLLPRGDGRRIHVSENTVEALGAGAAKERAGLIVSHVSTFESSNYGDVDIHDNIVDGRFAKGLIFIGEGRNFAVHHNHLSGRGSIYGIRLRSLYESSIDHNNIRGVRFPVAHDGAGQSLRDVTISGNIMRSDNTKPNRGVVFFFNSKELSRVRVLDNAMVGGTAQTSAVAVTGDVVADVDVKGNDWSGSPCHGPRAVSPASWAESAVQLDNKGRA